jgi:hypothetical protein
MCYAKQILDGTFPFSKYKDVKFLNFYFKLDVDRFFFSRFLMKFPAFIKQKWSNSFGFWDFKKNEWKGTRKDKHPNKYFAHVTQWVMWTKFCILVFSEITGSIETKIGRNVQWMVFFKIYVFVSVGNATWLLNYVLIG